MQEPRKIKANQLVTMNQQAPAPYSNSVSVDCVVFGFDGVNLNVLLVPQHYNAEDTSIAKLPGNIIYDNEDIPTAATRVLENLTGLTDIYLKHLDVFSRPNRIHRDDLDKLEVYYDIKISRLITVAYYALVKQDEQMREFTLSKGATWVNVDSITNLGLDHKDIVIRALDKLTEEFSVEPIAFELLPRYFTIRQFQKLYQAILGIELDSRNFRKKIAQSQYIIPTDKKETGVAHHPARYYTFNKSEYKKKSKATKLFF